MAMGMCGIIRRDYLEHPDIGFAFLPQYMGKGYAFEIAYATLRHARDKLNLPAICAIVLPENSSSIRLLEKLGLRFVRKMALEGSNEELLLYGNEERR